MKVLITDNLGYVGPLVVRHLRRKHPQARLMVRQRVFAGNFVGKKFARVTEDVNIAPASDSGTKATTCASG
jgi:hypothetical protein